MNLAMICAKIGLDLSKVEKNTKKHAIFCSILTFLLIFQFQQNFSAKHCKINIPYTFLVLLTPLSPLYLLKQWQKRNRDISVSVWQLGATISSQNYIQWDVFDPNYILQLCTTTRCRIHNWSTSWKGARLGVVISTSEIFAV